MKQEGPFAIVAPNGLFSEGGAHPIFTKKGKMWATLSALKNHIHCTNRFRKYKLRGCQRHRPDFELWEHPYQDCKIVRVKTEETDLEFSDLVELFEQEG